MSDPSRWGVTIGNMMLLLGRLPSKTFDLTSVSVALGPSSCGHGQLGIKTRWRAHLAHVRLGLAECERLWLSEEVGQEDTVVLRVGDGVERRRGCQEVGRDDLGALMHELIERVLAVSARCAPDDGLQVEDGGLGDTEEVRGATRTPV